MPVSTIGCQHPIVDTHLSAQLERRRHDPVNQPKRHNLSIPDVPNLLLPIPLVARCFNLTGGRAAPRPLRVMSCAAAMLRHMPPLCRDTVHLLLPRSARRHARQRLGTQSHPFGFRGAAPLAGGGGGWAAPARPPRRRTL
jgi:hypothetical protein